MEHKKRLFFEGKEKLHVLFFYTGMRNYMEEVIHFIHAGIEAGEYVILVENERNFNRIYEHLKPKITSAQMKQLHYVNSLDFYFSSGGYHPPAITEYFNKTVQPYIDNNISFRSWAHVEWATMEEPYHLIGEFERIVDTAVNQISFPLICAYGELKMPHILTALLLETHPYILKEDKLILSKTYIPNTPFSSNNGMV
ncbi:MEDS domain-containing protein [Niallia sp. FSL W8-0635]|uniref:MEDS domain-containing protein n=1 Tax=Niallia sp. FSL W8-0635 TaxID=2975337 RepID=UPI002B02AFD6|nr:MEDS domain-containing protein [Yersinia enterocolitica]